MRVLVFSDHDSEHPRSVVRAGTLIALGVVLIMVCALIGATTFRIAAEYASDHEIVVAAVDQASVTQLEQHLVDHRTHIDRQQGEIDQARRFADTHLNALGTKLGLLQAHVMRLNAVGERLTDISGLDEGEFNFNDIPGIGGAGENSETDEFRHIEFMQTLDGLETQLERNEQQLSVLEALILDRNLDEALYPDSWPMDGGWISSKFGYRRDPFTGKRDFHHGLDVANKPGAHIKAVASGVVSFVGKKPLFGLTVEINHGNDYVTRYGHTSEILVSVGDRIEKGQSIAVVGTTGRSTGLHLHFEVHKGSERVDPLKYLRAAR